MLRLSAIKYQKLSGVEALKQFINRIRLLDEKVLLARSFQNTKIQGLTLESHCMLVSEVLELPDLA